MQCLPDGAVLAVNRANWVTVRRSEGSDDLPCTNECLLIRQCNRLAQLESSYRRDDRHMARTGDHHDVDRWVRRCRNKSFSTKCSCADDLSERRSPFKDRGNLGSVMRDLADKSFGRRTSSQRNNAESVRVLINDIECLASHRTSRAK